MYVHVFVDDANRKRVIDILMCVNPCTKTRDSKQADP